MTLEEKIDDLHEVALKRYKTKANYLIEDYRNALHPVFRQGVQDAAEELEVLSALQDAKSTEGLLDTARELLGSKDKQQAAARVILEDLEDYLELKVVIK